MRPLQLTLENFGPFAETQRVDFEALDEIFLISGPTGSGKTTIFDGLLYALYGGLAGTRGDQDISTIKSNFTPEEGIVRVCLDFEAGSRRFRVERTLRIRRKKSGELTTEKDQAFWELKGPTRDPQPVKEVSGLRAINSYIQELLHLSLEEFSRIILLPQGEFQKFLEEDSRGRQDILQKIFPTDEHARLTARIDEKRSAAAREMDSLRAQREEIESELDLEHYHSRIQEKQEASDRLEKERKVLREQEGKLVRRQEQAIALSKDFEQLRDYSLEAEALDRRKEEMNQLELHLQKAQKAIQLAPQLKEMERLSIEIRRKQEALDSLEKEKDALLSEGQILEKEIERRKELEKRRSALVLEQGELQPLKEKEVRLSEYRSQLEEKKKQQTEIESQMQDLQQKQKELSGELARLKDSGERLETLAADLQSISREIFDLEKDLDIVQELSRVLGQIVDGAAEIQENARDCQVHEWDVRSLEEKQKLALASNLSSVLEEGKACPVCGATEHPAPAHLSGEPFTEEERLEASRRSLQASRNALNRALGNTGSLFESMRNLLQKRLSDDQNRARKSLQKLTKVIKLKKREVADFGQADLFSQLEASAVMEGQSPDAVGTVSDPAPGRSPEFGRNRNSELEDSSKHGDQFSAAGMVSGREELFHPEVFEKARKDCDELILGIESRLGERRHRQDQIEIEKAELQKGKESLNTIEEEIETSQKQIQQKQSELAKIQSDISGIQSYVQGYEEDLKGRTEIQKSLEAIAAEILGCEEEMARIDAKEKQHAEAVINNQSAIDEIVKWKKEALNEEAERNRELEQSMKEKGIQSPEEIQQAPSEEEIEREQKRLEEYRSRRQRLITLIESLEKELKDRQPPDLESLEKEMQSNRLRLEETEKELEEVKSSLKAEKNKKEKFEEISSKLSSLSKENEALFQLANDLKGKNHRNVNFQNFILHHYLQDVAHHANHRLRNLSDGRYELIVSSQIEHGNKQTGLNLDIMDAHTGVPRSVKSLSGGEKFLASLSLALGLADAIQERAGRIEMDSLFLDEGFGTLDSEALNRAMTILEEIRESRMVGIISHVDELKRTIPCQLRVIRSREGSRISINRSGLDQAIAHL